MTRKPLAALLFAGMITSLMTGCSGDDEYLFEHGPAGPNTEQTLKTLPEGLRSDSGNASHTADSLKPADK